MDLGIKELGITFLVGAFTILGLELILYYFFNTPLTGFFQGRLGLSAEKPTKRLDKERTPSADISTEDNAELQTRTKDNLIESKERLETATAENSTKDHEDSPMRTAVFIGLAFAIGVIAEDVSYKYRDSLSTPFGGVSQIALPQSLIYALDLPFKYDPRAKTLFKDLEKGTPIPEPLAEDLARTKSFSMVDPIYGKRVEAWITSDKRCTPTKESTETCPSLAEIESSGKRLYYLAKNKVYAEDNYYDEMKKIQIRMDFSRSLAMIAFVYFVVAVFMVLVLMVGQRKILLRSGTLIAALKRQKTGNLLLRVPVVLLTLFLIYFVAIWAYARESDEFNKRAFGYYSSMQIKQQPTLVSQPPSARVKEYLNFLDRENVNGLFDVLSRGFIERLSSDAVVSSPTEIKAVLRREMATLRTTNGPMTSMDIEAEDILSDSANVRVNVQYRNENNRRRYRIKLVKENDEWKIDEKNFIRATDLL